MPEHYFSIKPSSRKLEKQIQVTLRETSFTFITSSSVFSKDHIDSGTELLIEKCHIHNVQGSILDLGCGYGPVGIVLKKIYPECNVTCSDINERAVAVTKKNAEKNQVEIITVQSNIYDNIDETFDTVLVNLPQNAGKEICFKMIEGAFEHLRENGTLQVVSRHQKGGKTYAKKMKEVFGNQKTIARGSGYQIYFSEKIKK
ncbi:MAG: class I SAM-dependent methyltransferase [Candidatus Woesearchaeota archaeon]